MTGRYLLIACSPSREGIEYGPAEAPDQRFGFFFQDERTGVGFYCDAQRQLLPGDVAERYAPRAR